MNYLFVVLFVVLSIFNTCAYDGPPASQQKKLETYQMENSQSSSGKSSPEEPDSSLLVYGDDKPPQQSSSPKAELKQEPGKGFDTYVSKKELKKMIEGIDIKQVLLPSIQQDGITEDSLTQWLTKQPTKQDYNGETYYDFLSNQLYSKETNGELRPKPECVAVKYLSGGGFFSQVIYAVNINTKCLAKEPTGSDNWKMVIVVKEHKTSNKLQSGTVKSFFNEALKEISKLLVLRKEGFFSSFESMTDPKLPMIARDEDYFYAYNDSPAGKRENPLTVFTVLHAVKGVLLKDVLFKSSSIEDIKKAMTTSGVAMAKLHLRYMDKKTIPSKDVFSPKSQQGAQSETTQNKAVEDEKKYEDYWKSAAVHGDFHLQNAFYDKGSDRLYLIDNSGFEESLKGEKSIYVDLFRLPAVFLVEDTKNIESNPKLVDECVLAFVTFYEAYIATYPQEKQALLREYIVTFLKHIIDLNLFIYPTGMRPMTAGNETKAFRDDFYSKIIAGLKEKDVTTNAPVALTQEDITKKRELAAKKIQQEWRTKLKERIQMQSDLPS